MSTRLKRSSRQLCLLALVLALAACGPGADSGGDGGTQPPPAEPPTASSPNPTAEELWKILSDPAKPYTSWPFFYEVHPDTGEPISFPFRVSELPHGDYVAVYVNEPALESLKNPSDPFLMKPGSIMVKENYPGGDTPPSLDRPIGDRDGLLSRTVMWKVPGYNFSGFETRVFFPTEPLPTPFMVGGEWFWSMFTAGDPAEVITLGATGVQGFLTNPDAMSQFNPFIGETQTGKSWFCLNCHISATGAGFQEPNSYGDYVWRLVPFAPQPSP